MNREDWLNSLKSDGESLTGDRKWIDENVSWIIKEKGSIKVLEGVFGDQDRCNGYEEDIIKNEKGTFTKILGCSYLLKGFIDKEVIDTATATKRVLMEDIRFMANHPILTLFLLRKKTIADLIYRYERIFLARLLQLRPPYLGWKVQDRDYSPAIREFVKAGRQFNEKLTDAFALFLFADNAYLFPYQDIIGNLNKEELKQNPRKEIKRLLGLGIKRANHIKPKLEVAAKLISILLYWPKFLKIITQFLEAIEPENVKMDEADWYFSLKREGYDYGGLNLQERLKIREKIDKEKKHIII